LIDFDSGERPDIRGPTTRPPRCACSYVSERDLSLVISQRVDGKADYTSSWKRPGKSVKEKARVLRQPEPARSLLWQASQVVFRSPIFCAKPSIQFPSSRTTSSLQVPVALQTLRRFRTCFFRIRASTTCCLPFTYESTRPSSASLLAKHLIDQRQLAVHSD
jgi:hypothetical protein